MVHLSALHCVLGGIGLQISIAMASSALESTPIECPRPPSLTTFRTPASIMKDLATTPNNGSNRVISFASRQSSGHNRNRPIVAFAIRKQHRHNRDSMAKPTPSIDNRLSGFSFKQPASAPLFLLPEHYDQLSAVAPLVFLPVVHHLYDLAKSIWLYSFMFLAASSSIWTLERGHTKQSLPAAMAAVGSGGDFLSFMNAVDDEILTPADYASSSSAELEVEDTISTKASEAFDSTDFDHEPHLILTPSDYASSSSAELEVEDTISTKASEAFESTDFDHEPHVSAELEDDEAAVEVALLASAAHKMADAAEKKNRQSKAAMMEREKELKWIEEHDAMATTNEESIQRSLLMEQFIIKAKGDCKKREAVQRSLLSARISNDVKVRESIVDKQHQEERMGSEALAASMGGQACMPYNVASAAAAAAASQALADAEKDLIAEENNDSAPVALGEDIASFGHAPELAAKVSNEDKQEIEKSAPENDTQIQNVLSEADQWRNGYVHEVRSYVQQKGIELTKEKKSTRTSDLNDIGRDDKDNLESIDTTDTAPSEDTVINSNSDVESQMTSGESVIERTVQRGLFRRLQKRRNMVVVALGVVLCRRLFLAYFGNAMRLL